MEPAGPGWRAISRVVARSRRAARPSRPQRAKVILWPFPGRWRSPARGSWFDAGRGHAEKLTARPKNPGESSREARVMLIECSPVPAQFRACLLLREKNEEFVAHFAFSGGIRATCAATKWS